jgi:hypothetical protein
MLVRIESVSDDVVALRPSAIGFRVAFVADAVRGQAWFVPANGGNGPPRCESIGVETEVRSVRHLRVLPRLQANEPRVVALPGPGDYQVCGIVEAAWPEGEACDGAYIRADGWTFTLSVDQCAPDEQVQFGRLIAGDAIEFEALDLSLWDEHL